MQQASNYHPFDQGLLSLYLLFETGEVYSIRQAPARELRAYLTPYFQRILAAVHPLAEVAANIRECLQRFQNEVIDALDRWWAFYLLSEQMSRPPLYFSLEEALLAQRNLQLARAYEAA